MELNSVFTLTDEPHLKLWYAAEVFFLITQQEEHLKENWRVASWLYSMLTAGQVSASCLDVEHAYWASDLSHDLDGQAVCSSTENGVGRSW